MSFSRLSQSRAITVVKIGGKLTAFSVLSMKKRQKHRFKKNEKVTWKKDQNFTVTYQLDNTPRIKKISKLPFLFQFIL